MCGASRAYCAAAKPAKARACQVRRVFARHRSIELGSAFGTPKAEAGRLSSRVSTWRTREAEKLAMSLHSHFNFDVCLVVDVRSFLFLRLLLL